MLGKAVLSALAAACFNKFTMQLQPNRWFAVSVRVNLEARVGSSLHRKGYECFVPTCPRTGPHTPRSSKPEPMFPGYVFCRMQRQPSSTIVSTPGVIRILGYGCNPSPVEDIEILSLQKIMSSGVHVQPLPRLEKGDAVLIRKGPLTGVSGVLQGLSQRRNLIVSVGLLGRSVSVELAPDWIADSASQ